MLPDRKEVKSRIFWTILSSPIVVFPFLAGSTILIGTWALGLRNAGLPIFAALCCILGSVGSFFTRLLTKSEALGKEIVEQMQQDAIRARDRELDELENLLSRDGDNRTEQCLKDLRILTEQLNEATKLNDSNWSFGMDLNETCEIALKVERLFQLGVQSLKRTLQLWETAQKVHLDSVRQPLFDQREKIIADVMVTIEYLGKILASIQKLSLMAPADADLEQARQELDHTIRGAAEITAEIREWKRVFGKTPAELDIPTAFESDGYKEDGPLESGRDQTHA